MKGPGSDQQPNDDEDSDGKEEVPLQNFGSATNASTSTTSNMFNETSSQSETITEPEVIEIRCQPSQEMTK